MSFGEALSLNRVRTSAPAAKPTPSDRRVTGDQTGAFALLSSPHGSSSGAPSSPRSGAAHCRQCGGRVPSTRPGERTPKFCGVRCGRAYLAAKRRTARLAAPAGTAATPKAGGSAAQRRLGKKSAEFPTVSDQAVSDGPLSREIDREAAAKARRSRRYSNRRVAWKVSSDKAVRGCGRAIMDPDAGLIIAQTAEGYAATLGLLKCGRIWLCPVCSAQIRQPRSEETTNAVKTWIERGGTAMLVTFTARHAANHSLDALLNALQGSREDKKQGIKRKPGAYQRLISGGTWAGRPERGQLGIRDRIGYIGMMRATEVTIGQENGWHPHIHAIVLMGGTTTGTKGDREITGTFTPGENAITEFQDHWRQTWTNALASVDKAFKPNDEHGVDFKPIATVADAKSLGDYLIKTQDGKNPAQELTRGDLKGGREGNMTPFEMLERIGGLMGGVVPEQVVGHGELPWCRERWDEYEQATKGRRALEWTRYLRKLLGIDGGDSDEDNMDALFETDAASEFRAGVQVMTDAWYQVAASAMDLSAIEAVEGRGIDMVRVSRVFADAGAGPDAARLLTPGELAEAWDATLAKLAKRREDAAERRRAEAEGDRSGQNSDSARLVLAGQC